MTVTIHQAKTHLSRLLQQVERGEEIVICRGKLPVARIVRSEVQPSRPKVGETTSPHFAIPEDAFAPMGDEELKSWGLS